VYDFSSGVEIIETGWMTKESWFNSWQGQFIFLFYKSYRLILGLTQPHTDWVLRLLLLDAQLLAHETERIIQCGGEERVQLYLPSFHTMLS
jgi:hypothetical protein